MSFLKSKSKISSTIKVIIVTLIIAVLANSFRFAANDAVINTTLNQMEEIGKQHEIALEIEINKAIEDLNILANYIASSDEADINNIINSQTQISAFNDLYYIDINGQGVSINGDEQDFTNDLLFLQASINDYFIAKPHISQELSEIALDISVPVKKDGEVTGVLLCEVTFDNFLQSYSEDIDGKGDFFIVDQELDLVFSTNEAYTQQKTIPQEDVLAIGEDNLIKAENDIKANQSGSFYYTCSGIDKVMVYMPIEMTKWALVINIDATVINSEIATAVSRLNTICITIYWFLIALICLTSFMHMRTIRILAKTAYYDILTGLPNIEKLKLEMGKILNHDKNTRYSVLTFDIENFKAINELFGYEKGDEFLKVMAICAERLNEPNLIMARVGSDKFLIFAKSELLKDLHFLDKEFKKTYDEIMPEFIEYDATYKCGRYNIEIGENDLDGIINKVLHAHKKAKDTPGQVLCDYDETFKLNLLKDIEITNKMRSAIKNEEFHVYLQPKFGISDDILIGAESLVRWVETDGNMIYPNDFIPLFEKNNFIIELDKYMLEKTCIIIKKWIDTGLGGLTVSVNLSRVNLGNPKIVDNIIEIVDKYNVPHEFIEIELTESASAEQEEAMETLYTQLYKHGFKTSIDDFGAGYSSLAMLKNLSVSTLKMDRRFFTGGKSIRRDDMLINGIVKLSHSLGMYVVAEGIETAEQISMLKEMNCDAVQGYFYDKPMPVDDFEEKYKDIMLKATQNKKTYIPLIQNINDAKYANSFVPCGIVVAKLDSAFTLVEANDGYFEILGFTRRELRDIFGNSGKDLLHPADKVRAAKYIEEKMKTSPDGQISIVCRVMTKNNGYKLAQFSGKISKNENNQNRIYCSFVDITSYAKTVEDFKRDDRFITEITSLENNAFFDYDIKTETMSFSKNFAEKFDIPEFVDKECECENGNNLLKTCKNLFNKNKEQLLAKHSGEFIIKVKTGESVRFNFNSKVIYDDNKNPCRVVGKMYEVLPD